jgi:hypothetical protein
MTEFAPGHPGTTTLGSAKPYGAQLAKFKSIFVKKATPERIEKLADDIWKALEEEEPKWDAFGADANRIAWRKYMADLRQQATHMLLGKDPQVLIQINNNLSSADKREKALALLASIGAKGMLPVQAGGTNRTLREVVSEQSREG